MFLTFLVYTFNQGTSSNVSDPTDQLQPQISKGEESTKTRWIVRCARRQMPRRKVLIRESIDPFQKLGNSESQFSHEVSIKIIKANLWELNSFSFR